MTAPIIKVDQKKQKDILRKDTLQMFLLKHNDAKKHKFDKSIFDDEIRSFWSYEKPSWKNEVCGHFI